ncbi:MAG: glycosyltransferase family 4 protein [Cyanobacteria bacterium P01_A01_bin.45]
MKLCIVTHSVVKGNGQGRVNYEITWEAIRRGHHVTLLASQVASELEKHQQINWIPLSVEGVPTELLRNLVFAFNSSKWLRKHRSELDLVKANGAITFAQGDVNAVHFVHGSWLKFSSNQNSAPTKKLLNPQQLLDPKKIIYNFYQWFYTSLNANWEKQAFAQAQKVVAVSNKVGEDLVDIGVKPESLQVILNGVDLEEFVPGKSDRQKWNLPKDKPVALFAGDIRIPRKNLDTVLHALVKVPELHLAVAGITEGSPYLELAKSLKLSDRVDFLGLRDDVPELMKAVDFLVFPSRYEPYGLVVIEAMATGIPVVTASSTGAAALVTPEAGIVIPDCDDVDALADALQTIASNPAIREKMGKEARIIAEQHSWDNMAKTYVNLFEEITEKLIY